MMELIVAMAIVWVAAVLVFFGALGVVCWNGLKLLVMGLELAATLKKADAKK